jgi:cell division inhibitor SepF
MAGTMRKMAVYLGLVEDDLDAELDNEPEPRQRPRDYQPPVADVRSRPTADVPPRSVTTAVAERPEVPRSVSYERPSMPRPAPVGQSGAGTAPGAPKPLASAAADMHRITTLHPRSYNDARRVGEEFRDGVPVIINLTGMDDSDAKRIVDFAAGLVFGLRGTIERVTNKVFLLSPANVDVGAEARAQIAQDGFFNQS